MKLTFRTWLVASAVAVSAASLGAAGIDTQQSQTTQSQSSQSSQSGQSTQSTEPAPSSQSQQSRPGAQGRDEAGARQELVQAKQALTDLTKLPDASQLQGEARNGVIQIINSFNALVTADANWYDRYQEVQQQLSRILGSDVSGGSAASGSATGAEAGSTGTSGSASADVPAPIRSKLVEFRQHLTAFAKAAGAPGNGVATGTGSSAASPSEPSAAGASSATSGQSSSPASGQSAQPGTTTSASGETFQQHFDAIGDLVQQALGSSPASSGSGSTTGTSGSSTSTSGSSTTGQPGAPTNATSSSTGSVPVDRATLEQIQSHLQRLRELARQRGIQ